ncbi:MAG: MBL fold metallo-hydrolase [Candidatus Eremiobacteraeota bacterium]|nr:MBL fold metallo-hydrolase [Candidatus Eremiobacteraeota bacterium]
MEFRIVSHACLEVAAGGKRLVIDPWLNEPTYWSSWWHCPPPIFTDEIFNADYVYITHWHFDHFDPKTLRKFAKHTSAVVPKFPISGLKQQLEEIGFSTIVELRHGQRLKLAEGFWLTSYQVSFQDDSVAVVEADGVVLVDLNDAKPLPSLWRTFRAKYPHPDFMLRSHSPAWSYPTRYTFDDASDRLPVDARTYMEAFVAAAVHLQPRHAVPFASGICHLHREVRDENRFLVSAPEMRAYFEANAARVGTSSLVVMPVGSRWSSESRFELTDNVVEDVVAYAEQRALAENERLEKTYRSEATKEVSFDDFSKYFEKFFKATRLLRPLIRKTRWVFPIDKPEQEYWCVDFGKATIERSSRMPQVCDSVISASASVLSGSLRNDVFTNVDISKRWRVHIKRGSAMRHFVVANLLLLYEAGYLSPTQLFSWRFLTGYARRLPEVVDYMKMAFRTAAKGKDSLVTAVTSIAEG